MQGPALSTAPAIDGRSAATAAIVLAPRFGVEGRMLHGDCAHRFDRPAFHSRSSWASPAAARRRSGKALAERRGVAFIDGDDLHSPEARAKMTAGIPLTDEDRAPWLDRIGHALADVADHPDGAVVACSALRRVYRDHLRAIVGASLRFLFLKGDKALMRSRVAGRKGHYMPASLIDSQFATLESPEGEADVVTLAADVDLSRVLGATIERLSRRRGPLREAGAHTIPADVPATGGRSSALRAR